MFRFARKQYTRLGPLGVGFAVYRLWRRLSPEQRAVLPAHARRIVARLRAPGATEVAHRSPGTTRATTTSAEIDPGELTSPGTVSEPHLEAQRAQEAAQRERESRESPLTKFEELRQQQESERARQADAIGDPPRPRDEP